MKSTAKKLKLIENRLGLRFPLMSQELYKLEPEKCTSCGICEMVCPSKAITVETFEEQMDEKSFQDLNAFMLDYSRCLRCDLCVYECPENALSKQEGKLPVSHQLSDLKVDLTKRKKRT